MSDLDGILQEKLSTLEGGMPVEDVLTGLSEEAKELAPLIQLVAEVRALPQPALSTVQANIQEQKVLRAAQESKMSRSRNSVWKLPRWAFAAGLTGALTLLVVVGIILTIGLLWIGQRHANSAVLVDANGYIEMASVNNPDHWRALEQGDRVYAGQRIRTYPSSNAVLRFVEGSQLTLGPMTDLTFSELTGSQSGKLQVLVFQQSGDTAHQVIPFQNDLSSYVVQTPSGNASVHGTRFGVVVNPADGVSHFAVSSGTVAVSSADREVPVNAGQVTTTRPNSAPETPAYMFDVTGLLTAYSPSQLTVAGITIAITSETVIQGEPTVGRPIHVEGHIADGGVWVADIISTIAMPSPSSFSGVVDSVSEQVWIVGGISVRVDANTAIDEGLGQGDAVNVTFIVLTDGGWLATSIRSLNNEEPPIAPSPNPGDEQNFVFDPDELEAEGCQTEFSLTGTLRNEGEQSGSSANSVVLGYTILSGAEYLSSFEMVPSSWEVIQPGEAVTFTIHTVLNDKWLTTPEAEFTARIFVDEGSNGTGENPELMVTLVSTCEVPPQTPTPTATITTTLTPTPTMTPTPIGTPPADCTGADPQPHAVTLAERYGVTYETIMGWFCQGYGFGEIEHAYQLRDETGQTVEYIFSLRAGGMGWGNIRKLLLGEPNNRHNP